MWIKHELREGLKNAYPSILLGGTVYTTEKDRGIGKTTLLVEESLRSGRPLLVESRRRADQLKKDDPGLLVEAVEGFSLRGRRFPKGALIDEGSREWQAEIWQVMEEIMLVDSGATLSGFRRDWG